jgi:hypothetical protein
VRLPDAERHVQGRYGRARGLAPIAPATVALFVITTVAMAVVTSPKLALANGRFPRAQRLLEDPNDPDHLTLAATFGLLTTSDRGAHWYHVCEASFAGDDTYAGDPLLDRVAGGALLVGVQSAIRRSSDGCSWTPTLGPPAIAATDTIDDFAVDRASATTVVAIATQIVNGAARVTLRESTDAGVTWTALGSPLPASRAFTVDLDPTDSSHIVATGLSASAAQTGIFLQSLDRGTTWSSVAIPTTDYSSIPYIAAIHPQNPKQVFVRTDGFVLPAGADQQIADDALLVSADGGATWKEVLRKSAKLLGFAISPDGATVLAGYGDPVEPGYSVDPADMGIYRAAVADFQFDRVFSGNNVTCLTWTRAGTYVCTEAPEAGTYEELALFDGHLDGDGAAPRSVLRLSDVAGPPPCCADVARVCAWQTLCATFNACSDSGAPAATCRMGPTVPTGDAAAANPGRDANAGSAGDGGRADQGSSGGCRLVTASGASPRGTVAFAPLLAIVTLAGLRRAWRRPPVSR